MICVSRKNRSNLYRNNLSAETAVPCISCATGIAIGDITDSPNEGDYFFAGIARSKSIRECARRLVEAVPLFSPNSYTILTLLFLNRYDDGMGPTTWRALRSNPNLLNLLNPPNLPNLPTK